MNSPTSIITSDVRDATRMALVSVNGYQQQPRRVSRLAGILVFGAFIIYLAIAILVALGILGSIFSSFDQLTNMLPSNPNNWLGLFNALKTTTANVFPLLTTMMIIASIGVLVAAIFRLASPGSED
jgi:uncharacterized protein involved in cysteine biosynthesis